MWYRGDQTFVKHWQLLYPSENSASQNVITELIVYIIILYYNIKTTTQVRYLYIYYYYYCTDGGETITVKASATAPLTDNAERNNITMYNVRGVEIKTIGTPNNIYIYMCVLCNNHYEKSVQRHTEERIVWFRNATHLTVIIYT